MTGTFVPRAFAFSHMKLQEDVGEGKALCHVILVVKASVVEFSLGFFPFSPHPNTIHYMPLVRCNRLPTGV